MTLRADLDETTAIVARLDVLRKTAPTPEIRERLTRACDSAYRAQQLLAAEVLFADQPTWRKETA